MDAVKATDILNLKVKAIAATRVQQLRAEASATRTSRLLAGTGVEASYTVQVNSSQVPSSSLLAQLQEAVASYAFDDALHRNALDDGAVALAYASSEAVRELTDVGDGGGDDNAGDDEDTASVALSTGAIVGISVGGGVAVLAIALIVSCATKSTNKEKVTPN
jgi:hypothetical protein